MNIDEKRKFIKKCVEKCRGTYIDVNNDEIELIYDLYKNGTNISYDELSEQVLIYFGFYYSHQMHPQYELAEKYYLTAIKKGNVNAMNNLAYLYRNKSPPNYELAEKYYLMAIERQNQHAMNNLAYMYVNQIPTKHKLAKKYYLMAIKLGSTTAMNNLAYMYSSQTPAKYELSEKYYLMALYNGDFDGLNLLIKIYNNNNDMLYLSKLILFENYKQESNSNPNAAFVFGLLSEYYLHNQKALPYYELAIKSGNQFHIDYYIDMLIRLDKKLKLIDFLISKSLMNKFQDRSIYHFINSSINTSFAVLINDKIQTSKKINELTLAINKIAFSPNAITLKLIKKHFEEIQNNQ